jgi:hypothetical protein
VPDERDDFLWADPREWLFDHLDELEQAREVAELRSIVMAMTAYLSTEEIVELFHDEMQAGGYYRPLPKGD